MSGHPLSEFSERWKHYNFNSSKIQQNEDMDFDTDDEEAQNRDVEFDGLVDNMRVTCGGLITEIKKIISKNGNKPMAILKIEDLYGTFTCMVVPKVYEQIKKLLAEDAIVDIVGKFSYRPGKEPVVMVERLSLMQNYEQKEEVVADKTLYLKYNMEDQKISDKINLVLSLYKGEYPVVVRSTADNKAYRLPQKVNGNNHLINELIGVVGDGNVILK